MQERADAISAAAAGLGKGSGVSEEAHASGVYAVECYDSEGNLRWSDTIDNLVTTVGKNELLDKGLAGSSYTAAWYVGLIDNGSWSAVNAADTMASHAGWTENTGYSQSTRPAASWSAASAGAKALSSAASFTINADDTIKGCFLVNNSTKGGTTGVLYSAGLFTAGDKVVQNGDTLNVSYTASL